MANILYYMCCGNVVREGRLVRVRVDGRQVEVATNRKVGLLRSQGKSPLKSYRGNRSRRTDLEDSGIRWSWMRRCGKAKYMRSDYGHKSIYQVRPSQQTRTLARGGGRIARAGADKRRSSVGKNVG